MTAQNKHCERVVLQNSNLQPLDYWSCALPIELERPFLCMLNFFYFQQLVSFMMLKII